MVFLVIFLDCEGSDWRGYAFYLLEAVVFLGRSLGLELVLLVFLSIMYVRYLLIVKYDDKLTYSICSLSLA